MSARCCVPGCRNQRSAGRKSVSFHRFPAKGLQLRQLWAAILGVDDSEPDRPLVVCSEHFCADDVVRSPSRRFVREGAVPIHRVHSEVEGGYDPPPVRRRGRPPKAWSSLPKKVNDERRLEVERDSGGGSSDPDHAIIIPPEEKFCPPSPLKSTGVPGGSSGDATVETPAINGDIIMDHGATVSDPSMVMDDVEPTAPACFEGALSGGMVETSAGRMDLETSCHLTSCSQSPRSSQNVSPWKSTQSPGDCIQRHHVRTKSIAQQTWLGAHEYAEDTKWYPSFSQTSTPCPGVVSTSQKGTGIFTDERNSTFPNLSYFTACLTPRVQAPRQPFSPGTVPSESIPITGILRDAALPSLTRSPMPRMDHSLGYHMSSQDVSEPIFSIGLGSILPSISPTTACHTLLTSSIIRSEPSSTCVAPRAQQPCIYHMTMARSADHQMFLRDVKDWKMSELCLHLCANGFCREAYLFSEEAIDGEALLLLSRDDCIKYLSSKVGPALALYHSVVAPLQRRSLSCR